jgi:long-chain acyl-CoA synthetase
MNLKEMLWEAAKRYRRKIAIIFGKLTLSYVDLEELSNKLAHTLISLGIHKGDRVAILLTNCPEFVISYFGVIKSGAIAVPLDTKYKVKELAVLFNNCKPKILVSDDAFLEPLTSVLPLFISIKHIINTGSKYKRRFVSFRRIMEKGQAQEVDIEINPEDTAHIAYTSGPTFRPKGVMIPHRGLVKSATESGDAFQQNDKDLSVLFALPLHHAFGLVVVLLASLIKGSAIAIMPGLSMSSLAEFIEKEKATTFWGVPFIFSLMIRAAEEEGLEYDLSSLRLCVSAGAPLPSDTVRRFKNCFGLNIIEFWGLTEAIGCVTSQPTDTSGKLGSVGKALPGYDVKVLDNRSRELPGGQVGDVVARGVMMKGYYRNYRATAAAIKGGWLYTGDLGKLDEDGDLFLTGRKREMIITKGQNIFPSDIEDVLKAHPKIREAAVVGIPDETRGEIAGAFIVMKEGESIADHEIIRHCREYLANYKLPKQVVFVDALPNTASRKVMVEALRRLLPISSNFIQNT